MNNLPIDVAVPDPEPADERAAFQTEFDKLGYQWSESNQAKAFVGWQLARKLASLATKRGGMSESLTERHLRRLLAVRVGMPNTYYDDGEAQGSEHGISIDFIREPVAEIDFKLRALNLARAEAAPAVAQCRSDGRCQYAIDHDAEGLGHCPPSKCAMPAAPEAPAQRCPYCDDTGDVHTPTGEWRGRCTCPAGTEAPAQAAQSAGEVERTDEELRKIAHAGRDWLECFAHNGPPTHDEPKWKAAFIAALSHKEQSK